MTAAAYTTDLATVDLAEAAGTWVILTATNWTSAGTPTNETDYFIQGTSCWSKNTKTGVGGLMSPAVANFTIPTDGAVLIWLKYDAPNSLNTEANGGLRTLLGNSQSVFYGWKILGSDTYTYGGWQCVAINDTVGADYTLGSPASPWQRVGIANNPVTVPSKGNPFGVDAARVGRCEARFAGGTSPDAACTFAGFATVNDNNSNPYNRWGLLQAIAGGYLWQGLMVVGYGAACRFTDANVNVTIANTKKVTANFNKIEIRNASTEVNWTAVSFIALGTVSRGNFEVVDDCNVNIASCSFAGMGTFILKAATDVLDSTFRNCGQITANAANFSGTAFTGYEGTANTSYMIWDTNTNTSGKLDGCTFTKGTAATHAVEFGTTSPTAFTLVGVTFTGYSGSNNANDSAIHIKRTSGDVTITIQGGTQPSYRSDGANVIFVLSSVSATVYAKDISGNNVDGARVFLKAANGNGYFPFEDTVTIANSGTTATVTHTGHGLASGDKVLIDGASHWQNNGVFSITKTGVDTYTYTLPNAPGSNPTGTIKATFVVLEGLTSSGFITMSREFPSDQDVIGWVRKAPTAGPWFKPAPLTGTVDSGTGFSAVAVMISDG